jgi:2-methylcitrate dehydratase PrpD
MDDPAQSLARYACRARFEDLPAETVRTVVHALIDTIGAGLAGSASDFGRLVLQRAMHNGGRAESTVIACPIKLPRAEAAFTNAIMARALELDDVHEGSPRTALGHGGHVNVVVVPAVLAVADACDRPFGGRELITALAVGGDVMARIRLAGGDAGRLGWEGPTFGSFGVAAALANLLAFTPDEALSALSAAYAQCAGNIQSTSDGAWDVWLNAGTAARAGVIAVELAERGYKGTTAPLLGSSGLYPLYFRGEYHEEALLGELGKHFESGNVSIKPYATCKATHHALHTSAAILRRTGTSHRAVRKVVVTTSAYKMRMVALDQGGQPKAMPTSLAEAQFHLPFALAVCLIRGSALPIDLTTSLGDPRVLDLARRIVVRHDAVKDDLQRAVGYPPDDVAIEFDDGAVAHGCEEFVKGHPKDPFTAAEICKKFRRCIEVTGLPANERVVSEFLDQAICLPDASDVNSLLLSLARLASGCAIEMQASYPTGEGSK